MDTKYCPSCGQEVPLERTLQGIEGLTFVHLGAGDVVRHRIVADIVAAYERSSERRG